MTSPYNGPHPDPAKCRLAYAAAGWTRYWSYEQMPEWLRPAWHHEDGAYQVPR